jgi:anaerobic selenocysteine-containing dehydrogenase
MKISRRDFLKYCISSAAVLGLDASVVAELSKALAADPVRLPDPPVEQRGELVRRRQFGLPRLHRTGLS